MKGRTASSLRCMPCTFLFDYPKRKNLPNLSMASLHQLRARVTFRKVVHSLLHKTAKISRRKQRRAAWMNLIRLRSGENKIKNHYKNVPAIIEHYSMAFIKVSKKKIRKKKNHLTLTGGVKKSEIICVSCCIMDDQSKRVMNHFSPLFESKPLQRQPPLGIPPQKVLAKYFSAALRRTKMQSEGTVVAQFLVTLGDQLIGSTRVIVTLSPPDNFEWSLIQFKMKRAHHRDRCLFLFFLFSPPNRKNRTKAKEIIAVTQTIFSSSAENVVLNTLRVWECRLLVDRHLFDFLHIMPFQMSATY